MSVPILAYGHGPTDLNCVLLKYGRSYRMMLSHLHLDAIAYSMHHYAQARPKQCLHFV